MTEKIQQLEQALKKITVQQTSADGLISILVNGQQNVLAIRIDDQLLKKAAAGQLAKELHTLFNQVLQKSKGRMRQEIFQQTGIDINQYGFF